jgi:hypothetical protein
MATTVQSMLLVAVVKRNDDHRLTNDAVSRNDLLSHLNELEMCQMRMTPQLPQVCFILCMYLPFLGASRISEQARSHWTADLRHGGNETVAQTGWREATRKISISLSLFELFAGSASNCVPKIARCFRAVSAALNVCWTCHFHTHNWPNRSWI